ncbi:MAG TPA: hypothetical protein VHD63_18785, partial [Ktedonobacteraceae bacterium]|nr:hypothetical protein [Ktedonobacteraceae bacterium]
RGSRGETGKRKSPAFLRSHSNPFSSIWWGAALFDFALAKAGMASLFSWITGAWWMYESINGILQEKYFLWRYNFQEKGKRNQIRAA